MLTSLALIFISALSLGWIFNRLRLPALIGMLLTGLLLGPNILNLISPSLLSVSPDLRQMALVIILIRAGLSLDIKELRKAGRVVVLLCFVPALFEILAYLFFAPMPLDIILA